MSTVDSSGTETPQSLKQFMSNKTYDFLKLVAQIILPGLGTLYFALAAIWGLPYANEVVGTIVAVDTFLGLLLGLSTKAYNQSDAKYDGVIQITNPDDGPAKGDIILKNYEDPVAIVNQKEALFKVVEQK